MVVTIPSPILNPAATRLVRTQLGSCLVVDGLDVDVGAWPAVGRSVVGGLHDVSVEADRVSAAGLTARNVSARFHRVSTMQGRDLDAVAIRGGTVKATVTDRDLAAALPMPLVTVQILPGGVVLHAPLVPTVVVDVTAGEGDLVLRPRLAGVPLATLRIALPGPVRVRDVRPAAGRLELSATVDGDLELGRFGC